MASSFARLDTLLAQRGIEPLSLHPRRRSATSFAELGEEVVQTPRALPFTTLWADTLENMLEAIFSNFPENIFWDFDFLVATMVKQALVAERGVDYFLHEFNERIVSLIALFGNQSNIRFRYLHDFTYGFDWAKWVRKESQSRRVVGPFDLKFLDYLLGRGYELLQLIDERDRKYHPLDDHSYRNPFGFSREPQDETYLLTCLAERNLIPVAAWDADTPPIWYKPFQETREAISRQLLLSKEESTRQRKR